MNEKIELEYKFVNENCFFFDAQQFDKINVPVSRQAARANSNQRPWQQPLCMAAVQNRQVEMTACFASVGDGNGQQKGFLK